MADTGRKYRVPPNFFYEFRLDDMIPKGHLLRRINVFVTSVLGDLHEQLGPFYSAIGRPSVDPELMIRMLLVGYAFAIRSERRLCDEVHLNLAYRWFCRLGLEGDVPDHSTFTASIPRSRASAKGTTHELAGTRTPRNSEKRPATYCQ